MYVFTFLLLSFFAIKDVFNIGISSNIKLFSFALILLIFHDGFRWGIGTDWDAYLGFFEQAIWDNSYMDIGYVWFNKIVYIFTENYSVFLVIHAIIVYALISRTIYNYSVYPLLSLFLFYCLMVPYLGMNRQYISFAIALFGYRFIIDKKSIYFIILILFASLFHSSVLMFLFALLLNREIKLKYLLGVFILVVAISISGIINLLPLNLFYILSNTIGDKMTFYGSDFNNSNSILFTLLAIIKRSIWFIIVAFNYEKLKKINSSFVFMFNLYFISIVIYLLFNNTILQVVVGRGMLYFNITEIFIIPYIIKLITNQSLKKIAVVLIFLYGGITIYKGMNFYKDDLGVDIFRPYNSVLIDSKYNAMEDNWR